MIAILVGPVHGGKTSVAVALVAAARARGHSRGGILCPGIIADGARTVIEVVDAATHKRFTLADSDVIAGERVGRFILSEGGLAFGKRALLAALDALPALVVIDEVGPLELAGGGWAGETAALIEAYRATQDRLLLLVARERLLSQVREKWSLASAPAVRAGDAAVVSAVLGMLRAGGAASGLHPCSSSQPEP